MWQWHALTTSFRSGEGLSLPQFHSKLCHYKLYIVDTSFGKGCSNTMVASWLSCLTP